MKSILSLFSNPQIRRSLKKTLQSDRELADEKPNQNHVLMLWATTEG